MESKGWIKLHRSIMENPLWSEKPFSKGQAWIDLLLMANHEKNEFLFGNVWITVERGSFITSEYKLMGKWGWSKTKVRSFLNLLQSASMISKKTDQKKTTITVENYSLYQDSKTTERLSKDYQETTERLLKNPNKNEKNDKNEKKYIYYAEKVKLTEAEYERLCKEKGKEQTDMAIKYLSDYIIEKGYKTKDHNRTLRRWVFNAINKTAKTANNTNNPYLKMMMEGENNE